MTRGPIAIAFTSLPALAALLLAAATPAARAQDPQPFFGETVEVRVVNIEAVVTDADGHRVSGLTRDDFELRVDGREASIDYFSEIRDGLPAAPLVVNRAAPALAPRSGAANYLIFVDDVFTVGAEKRLVLEKISEQLDLLGAEDRISVVSWNGRRLASLASWTRSRSAAREALEAAAAGLSRGPLQERSALRPGRGLGRLDRLVSAAAAALRLSGAPEGRRSLLLLAGEWPTTSISFNKPVLRRPAGDRLGFRSYQTGDSLFLPLTDAANQLGYAIYPVDTSGLGASGPGAGADRPGAARTPSGEILRDAALGFLSRETGGVSLLNGRHLKAVAHASEDARSHYWIGFAAESLNADLRHRVRVRVRTPGLDVRARRDYADVSRRSVARLLVEAGLLLDETEIRPPDLELDFGAADIKRRKLEVPIEITIPADQMTFLAAGGEPRARAEVSLAAADDGGGFSEIETVPVAFETGDKTPSGHLLHSRTVTLWREPHDLVVVVRDLASGEILYGKGRYDPTAGRHPAKETP